MGKGTLIIVLGFSLITSFLIIRLDANSRDGLDATIEQFKTTEARLIANSGVEIYLEKLRRNKSLSGSFNNNPLFDGTFNISITGPDSALIITSAGYYDDKIHQTIVNAKRDPIPFPPIHSSLYVSSDNLSLNLNGNVEIDGNDHNIDGTSGPGSPLPGVTVDDPVDSAYVVDVLKPKISKEIKGAGGTPSVSTVDDNTDWLELSQSIIFAADITLPTGTYTTGTVLGTYSEPKVTYVTGDVHFSGTAEGSGILVINGNLTMSGQFTYKGVIIVYGNSTIVTKIVGNGGVFGATIIVGQKADIQSTGNSYFYYSSQAIENAKANLKSSKFSIVNWWE
ncbi:MAG: hypothetical protein IPJ03_15620 [Ignavibacteriales bacterium]|nr:hypothetical protein [Ignavibacteriales bacterium]